MKKHIGHIGKQAFTGLMLATVMMTAACGTGERIANIGKPPAMSPIRAPQDKQGYEPVALPMPPAVAMNTNPNSLWQPSRQTFFKDQRAHRIGDILTVMIDIKDEADLENKTTRARAGSESAGLSNLLGIEGIVDGFMPGDFDRNNLVGMNTNTASAGNGKIEREETVRLKMAAMVTQVLPNGNFVIRGKQEVRVNFELRELTLDGVIRPEDILNNNSISYEKIAEARISYGGRGQVTDMQQPRYGQQFIDAVMPF